MEALVGRLPEPDFWAGKKVFLTGHTGFKGGWLALWLHALGAKIHGFALAPVTEHSFFEAVGLADVIGHEIGDIRDRAALAASMATFAPDVVIHMAAQALVLLSYEEPVETYATNVMGTVHLLEAVRAAPSVRVTLIVTSDKCYDNTGSLWGYRETDPMGGHDPYSNSKGCAELVTAAYGSSFFTGRALGSVRAGNVIGGGDWSRDRLVPDIVTALLAGRAPVLRAPAAVRPWQHVLEPLSGYIAAIEQLAAKGETGAAWNFGPDPAGEVTVGEVARELCAAWGGGIGPVVAGHPMAGKEAQMLTLDSTKARRELGWAPRWNLDEALGATAAWYRAWHDGADMREFTVNQIAGYCGRRPAMPGAAQESL